MKLNEMFDDEYELTPLEQAALDHPHLYVVFYNVRQSRNNGTYLVNAKGKAEANKLVKAYDDDYVGMKAIPLKQAYKEWGDIEMWIPSDGELPRPGEAKHLESGT
jgi:hypothetical protein